MGIEREHLPRWIAEYVGPSRLRLHDGSHRHEASHRRGRSDIWGTDMVQLRIRFPDCEVAVRRSVDRSPLTSSKAHVPCAMRRNQSQMILRFLLLRSSVAVCRSLIGVRHWIDRVRGNYSDSTSRRRAHRRAAVCAALLERQSASVTTTDDGKANKTNLGFGYRWLPLGLEIRAKALARIEASWPYTVDSWRVTQRTP